MLIKALADLTPQERVALMTRPGAGPDDAARAAAQAIVAQVRRDGDAALRDLTKRFDGADLADRDLEVPRDAMRAAWEALTPVQRDAMEEAARNLTRYHEAQRPEALQVEVRPGVVVGREPVPLDRVGIYAPGGRAAYPSSVLMAAVPAKVAGVGERVLCSPPGPDGDPAASVLAACHLAGVERVFRVGGAQAIAAMALGTASVPRVAKVVGPGNAYVQAAKLLLQGDVGMDTPAGPSEALIVADAQAAPELVARELLCQAEHGPDSASVALVADAEVAAKAAGFVEAYLAEEPRRDLIGTSLDARGALLTVASVEEAVAFSNDYAPEHLVLLVAEPAEALKQVRHAGSVFLGPWSAVALGDYCAGSNHVLPTAGAARWSSALQVEDFVHWVTWQQASQEGVARIGPAAVAMARLEGLEAHARSVEARLGPGQGWHGHRDEAAGVRDARDDAGVAEATDPGHAGDAGATRRKGGGA